ncbi:hypothetical protein BC938DRAFT_477076 [Jimgerdemannia flammicorona]|uniref:Uncharacterized protein n=1 Tax=Jimgerdemannia flammicorona TaxID=994334 RepID=A0A433QPR9_9FUNG|nr:hypothetical protein BC938DRAFT_477076 [Jimgerdemannia flammicorona]
MPWSVTFLGTFLVLVTPVCERSMPTNCELGNTLAMVKSHSHEPQLKIFSGSGQIRMIYNDCNDCNDCTKWRSSHTLFGEPCLQFRAHRGQNYQTICN